MLNCQTAYQIYIKSACVHYLKEIFRLEFMDKTFREKKAQNDNWHQTRIGRAWQKNKN